MKESCLYVHTQTPSILRRLGKKNDKITYKMFNLQKVIGDFSFVKTNSSTNRPLCLI
jgi:hypothetical protein